MRKAKSRAKGDNRGRTISPAMQEEIWQVFATTGSKKRAAIACGVTEQTAAKYIRLLDQDQLAGYRQKAVRQLSGQSSTKARDIIDSIGEEDYKKSSLMQKSTSAAILIDKSILLERHEAALMGAAGDGSLPLPGEIEDLVSGIINRVKSIKVLDVHFAQQHENLASDIATKLVQAEEIANVDISDALVTSVDDLDGN